MQAKKRCARRAGGGLNIMRIKESNYNIYWRLPIGGNTWELWRFNVPAARAYAVRLVFSDYVKLEKLGGG